MFESIKNRWKEARVVNLRAEAMDAVMRLNGLPEAVNIRAADSLSTSYKYIVSESGPLENISNKGKLEISKMLKAKGRDAFKMDMGLAYGYFLLSMYIESSCLPGDDARFVHELTKNFLASALQVSEEIDDTVKNKTNV